MVNDDAVLDARDMAEEIEQAKQPRTFPDVINEWTDTCLDANRSAVSPEALTVILRLGALGQRLIYEANNIGMSDLVALNRRLGK